MRKEAYATRSLPVVVPLSVASPVAQIEGAADAVLSAVAFAGAGEGGEVVAHVRGGAQEKEGLVVDATAAAAGGVEVEQVVEGQLVLAGATPGLPRWKGLSLSTYY